MDLKKVKQHEKHVNLKTTLLIFIHLTVHVNF